MNDSLPKETELKVRYQPLSEGEIVGYLRRGQVIECLAVIGDWLQVRYEKEDAAWVRWRITTQEQKSTFLPQLSMTKRVTFGVVDTLRSMSLTSFMDTAGGNSSVVDGAATVNTISSVNTLNMTGTTIFIK